MGSRQRWKQRIQPGDFHNNSDYRCWWLVLVVMRKNTRYILEVETGNVSVGCKCMDSRGDRDRGRQQ